jgi:hypothetical protein
MKKTRLTRDEVTALFRALKEAEGASALACRLNVSRQYVYDVASGVRAPGPKVLDVLGLKRIREERYE